MARFASHCGITGAHKHSRFQLPLQLGAKCLLIPELTIGILEILRRHCIPLGTDPHTTTGVNGRSNNKRRHTRTGVNNSGNNNSRRTQWLHNPCRVHSSPDPNSRSHATKHGLRVPNPNSRGHATKRVLRVPNPNSRGHTTKRGLRVPNRKSRGHTTKRGLRVPHPNSRGHATKPGLRVPKPNSRGHATKPGLRVPNPNSRGHATKGGLRVPNPNSRGHTTKRLGPVWAHWQSQMGKLIFRGRNSLSRNLFLCYVIN